MCKDEMDEIDYSIGSEPFGTGDYCELELVFERSNYSQRILAGQLFYFYLGSAWRFEKFSDCFELFNDSLFGVNLFLKDIHFHRKEQAGAVRKNKAVSKRFSQSVFIPARFVRLHEDGGRVPAQIITPKQVEYMQKRVRGH